MISPLKPILTFFGVKDGKIEATALKRIADSLNNLINTYVAWADTVGQDYSISNFIKWLKNSQGEIVATELRMYALKAATLALNMVFAMFASWAISAGMNAFINWMKNAKTYSEQLISTMEDAHDAAEEAQQDVDDIQQKLDDLDQKVKDIGAEKIEDIVDPQEKAKIQEINNLLETQLRLKKQIADDENNKVNKAASDVFNDKSEVVVSNETPTSYAEADPNGIGVTVTQSKNVTRTEALREHTARVNELSDAYVKLMSDENATDEERAQAKKNLEDEISLTNDAGTKVSELADMYETDASKYGDVSAEVQECTDSMHGASDALERANNLLNGTTSVENTNLDAFKSKFKDVIEEIDNGYLSMQEAIAQYKDLSPLQAFGSMTGEAIINIDSDTAHQTEAEATALAKLHEIADANNISFEDLIGAFEQLGIVAASNTDDVSNYASQLEATMGVIDDLQSAYKACSTAVEEYNKYGYLSADALQSLLNIDSQYLSCLDLVDGKLQINKQRYAELLAAQYAQAEVEAIDQAITELNTIAKGDAAEKTQTLTTATEDEKNKLVALCPALEDATVGTGELAAALAAAQGAANGGNAEQIQAQIDAVMGALNTKITLLKKNTQAAISSGTSLGNQLNGFNEKTNKANKNNKSTAKSVTDVSSAFDTLNKAMKEYNQYGYLCADTAKSLVGLEDKFTACLTEQNGKLQINVEQFRKFVKEQLKEANATKDGGKSADEMNKILNYLDQNVDTTTISFEQLTDAIKGYGTAMTDAKEKTDAIKSAFSGLSEVMNNKTDRNNPFGLLDSDDVEKQHEALLQLAKDTDVFKSKAYNPETGEVDFNSKAFKDSVVEYLNGMADAAAQTGGAGAKAIEKNWRDAAKAIADGKISVEEFYNGLGYSLEKATKEIDDFQSGFSDITDIVDEYNLYGGLSIDNYQKLMALSPDYLSCLKLEDNQLVFNEAAYKQLLVDKLNDMITTYEQTDATKALADRLRELRDGLLNSKTGFKDAKDAAEEFKSAMSDLKEILSSVLSIFEKFNDKSNNDLKIWGDAMGKVIDKRIEALNKQKEALEENNEATERAIELSKAQDALARAQQQRTTRVYTENGYEWQANAEDVRTAREDFADKKREWNKKDAEKAIDDQIKKYNEFKDKLSEVMDDIGKSWKDYQKELEYTAQIQKMTITQMEGSLDGYHNKIIASLNTGSAITSIQNLITNLESLISTLTKLNNLYSMLKTGEYKDLGTKGLWDTIKGFFNKGGEEATGESANVVENFFKVIKSKVQTSGNGLIKTFSGIWEKIKGGAQSLFNGSGSGGGIISTFVNGFKAIGNAVSKSKIGSTILGGLSNVGTALVRGGGKLLAGAGKLIGAAGPALAAAGPYAIPIAAAAGLGIYGGIKNLKHQKEIWSKKEDGFGKKAIKSVATFFWDISPIGAIVNLCKDIFGKNKEIADNTKNNTSSGTSNNIEGVVIGNIKGKKAAGSKSIKQSGRYNVDELGPELIVRQPTSGRYTYLETGDGVIPADITSRLFDMGGNPDRWFTEQMERNAGISNVQNRTIEGDKITIGDIYIQNPVGGVDDLAREINQRMPAMYKQIQSKR